MSVTQRSLANIARGAEHPFGFSLIIGPIQTTIPVRDRPVAAPGRSTEDDVVPARARDRVRPSQKGDMTL